MRSFSASSCCLSTRVIVFCALSFLGSSTLAMDETVSSLAALSAGSQPIPASASQIMRGKRYTYQSENKRLPLYQFGLGKRWASLDDKRSQPFSFGLGKRTRQYSFGLGKRSGFDDAELGRISYGYQPNELSSPWESYWQGKRSGFNFGLGKREVEMGDDVDALHEKLPVKHSRDKYLFGLGKRLYEAEDEDEDVAPSTQLA